MTPLRPEIEEYVITTLQELAHDWDYSRPVQSSTLLFSELGFESLDAVVLGASIQEHYRCPMPFAELLAEVGQRPVRDLSVAELTGFIERQLAARMDVASGQ